MKRKTKQKKWSEYRSREWWKVFSGGCPTRAVLHAKISHSHSKILFHIRQ